MNPDMAQALGRLQKAIEVRGPAPDLHARRMLELRRDWPTLAAALANVLREFQGDAPKEWRDLR